MPTPEEIKTKFERLDAALQSTPLPTLSGQTRKAKAGEFMWMQSSHLGEQFKHSDSRNYLYLKVDGTIEIPDTREAFKQGVFDIVEITPPGQPTPEEKLTTAKDKPFAYGARKPNAGQWHGKLQGGWEGSFD
jgi:hypothetical protein